MSQLKQRLKRRLYLESEYLCQGLFAKKIRDQIIHLGNQLLGMLAETSQRVAGIRLYSKYSKLTKPFKYGPQLNVYKATHIVIADLTNPNQTVYNRRTLV